MANSGYFTMTGKGQLAIAPPAWVTEVVGRISVQGTAQYLSPSQPYRVMHAGWWGIGVSANNIDGVTGDTIVHWQYIDMNFWDYLLPISRVYGNRVFWQMGNGVTARMCVFW